MRHTYASFMEQGILKLFWSVCIAILGLFLMAEIASADSVNCGDQVTGNTKLTANLDCSTFVGDGPILQVVGPAELNLNAFTIIGNQTEDGNQTNSCIEVVNKGAKVWDGTVVNCLDGVVLAGEGSHKIWKITSKRNAGFGFRVIADSDGNRLSENQAIENMDDNFRVDEGSDENHLIKNIAANGAERGYYIRSDNNVLLKNKAFGNHDDALRLGDGINNEVAYNIFNGTESGEGVDLGGSGNIVRKNTMEHNERGIRIRDGDNVVEDNMIINNAMEGIRVEGSSNSLSGNIIKNNGFIKDEETGAFHDALKVESDALDNNLTKNLLSKNLGNGVSIDEDATGNHIKGNIAVDNGVDENYFDARDGNLDSQCNANIWCDNIFETKNQHCIDSKNCRERREKRWRR